MIRRRASSLSIEYRRDVLGGGKVAEGKWRRGRAEQKRRERIAEVEERVIWAAWPHGLPVSGTSAPSQHLTGRLLS